MKPIFWILIVLGIIAIIVTIVVVRKKATAAKNNTALAATDQAAKLRAIENQCESQFNTQAEVDTCVAAKLAA